MDSRRQLVFENGLKWFNPAILTLTFCLACPLMCRATAVRWTDASGSWSNPANWSSNPALPGPADDVTINSPGNTITLDVNPMIQSLSLGMRTMLESRTGASQMLTVSKDIRNEGVIRFRHGSTLGAGGNLMNLGDVHLTQGSKLDVKGTLNNSGHIHANLSSKVAVGGDFLNGRNAVLAGRVDSDIKVDGKFNNFGAVRLFGAGSHNGVMLTVGKDFNNFGTVVAQGGDGSAGAKLKVSGKFTNDKKGTVTAGGGRDGGTGGQIYARNGFDNHGKVTVASGAGNPAGGGGRLFVTGNFVNSRTGMVALEGGNALASANSRSYILGGDFKNSGNVVLGKGALLNFLPSGVKPKGKYIQTFKGATTTNNGTIRGDANIKAGKYGGTGTVTGNLKMAGTLLPGNDGLGTATVLGNYRQKPSGVLDEILAGTGAGQFGVTNVGGGVTLMAGSALDVSFGNGFTPGSGESWAIMDFEPGRLTGTFNYTPLSLGNGNFLDINYDNSAGDINLYVGRVAPTPEPASLLLFGSGLLGLAAFWKRLHRPLLRGK